MKKSLFYRALLAAFIMGGAASCADTTEVGGVNMSYLFPQDSSMVIEEKTFDAKFDTLTAKLYTVYQRVEGDRVFKEGDEIVNREHFEKSLDLKALFDHPEKVYVSDEKQLAQLGETNANQGEVVLEQNEETSFVRSILKQDFNFTLNAGEEIKASTKYEKCACLATHQELSFTAIRNVKWNVKSSTAIRNEKLSCKDSTVYDIVLVYDVALTRNDNTSTREQTVDTYTVNVPYQRIYKAGDVKLGGRQLGEVKREVISPTTERLSVTTYEEWSLSGKQNVVTESVDLPLAFHAPAFKQFVATSEKFETKGQSLTYEAEDAPYKEHNFTVTKRPFTYTTQATNGVETFQNVYTGSSASAVYVKEDVTVKFDYGEWTVQDGQTSITGSTNVVKDGVTYDSYDYFDHVRWTYNVKADSHATQNAETSSTAQAEVQILIKKVEEDKLLSKEAVNVQHEIVDDNTDKFTWEEVETWSRGGQKTTTKQWVRHRHFKAKDKQSVYTTNKEYSTEVGKSQILNNVESDDGDVHVTTRYMRYVARSDNKDQSFENVYDYDYQKGVYKDKDNKYTLEFDFPLWTIEEKGTSVSATSQKVGEYAVWTHTHNVKHNYVVTYEAIKNSKEGEAHALTDIYILDIKKNLPENWGDVIGIQVTAVPADDVDGYFEKHAFCLRTTLGAVAVVIDRDRELPRIDEITSAYFVWDKALSDEAYNSAFFTTSRNRNGLELNKWAPAIGRDIDGGVSYFYKNNNVANVSSLDLKLWTNWHNGHTVQVKGYASKLENGVLTVTSPKGEVLKLR